MFNMDKLMFLVTYDNGAEISQMVVIANTQFAALEWIASQIPNLSQVLAVKEYPPTVKVIDLTVLNANDTSDGEGEYFDYEFSCGNSSYGTVGFCAKISAKTPEEALAILKDELAEVFEQSDAFDIEHPGVQYINLYTNADAITLADITEITPSEYTPESEDEE